MKTKLLVLIAICACSITARANGIQGIFTISPGFAIVDPASPTKFSDLLAAVSGGTFVSLTTTTTAELAAGQLVFVSQFDGGGNKFFLNELSVSTSGSPFVLSFDGNLDYGPDIVGVDCGPLNVCDGGITNHLRTNPSQDGLTVNVVYALFPFAAGLLPDSGITQITGTGCVDGDPCFSATLDIVDPASVPEPPSTLTLATGLLFVSIHRFAKKKSPRT